MAGFKPTSAADLVESLVARPTQAQPAAAESPVRSEGAADKVDRIEVVETSSSSDLDLEPLKVSNYQRHSASVTV